MMNNTSIPALLALLFVFHLHSCKKDENKPTSSRHVTATCSDGSSVTFSDTAARTMKNAASPHPYIEVSGYTAYYSTSPRTGFWVYSYSATAGTYPIDGVNVGAFYNQVLGIAADTVRRAAYGTLVISAVTPNLTGTVSFTCIDSTVVSGTFSVPAP